MKALPSDLAAAVSEGASTPLEGGMKAPEAPVEDWHGGLLQPGEMLPVFRVVNGVQVAIVALADSRVCEG